MKNRILLSILLTLVAFLPVLNAADAPGDASHSLKIGIIGDSTVCDYPADSKQVGWGQVLPLYFSSNVAFLNEAEKGRSTKTFPADRWQKILAFKPDFILIQFGHNDSHPKTRPEATDAATDFKDNLKRYITEARAAGAVPVLVTPMHRRTFDAATGHLTKELEPYANAMRDVAEEVKAPLVDLYQDSGAMYEAMGEKESTPLTMNTRSNADQPKSEDRTHFTAAGAKAMAGLVAKDLAKVDPWLASAAIGRNPK